MKIIFLGPPGSGKGTYSSRICEQKGWAHISTGDMFRDEIKRETALGKQANEYIKKGELVPDAVTIRMLKERLEREGAVGFILDGFPRTLAQARELEAITRIDTVINLVIADEIIVKKISARRTCSTCGNLYNIADIRFGENNEYHMPPILPKKEGICDKDGQALVQRPDDTSEVVRNRIQAYHKQTAPLITYYKKQDSVHDIDGNVEIQKVTEKLYQVVDPIVS